MKKRILCVFTVLICLLFQSCNKEQPKEYTAHVNAMDTVAFVRVYDERYSKLADDCAELMLQLESELSVTLTGSRVYHLNKSGNVPITENLEAIIQYAVDIKEKTNGTYDPCIYPLVRLWGFTENAGIIPSEAEIEEAKKLVGKSELYVEDGIAHVTNGGAVDFGGIAKGYAASLMLKMLKENGVDAALIDLGGNIQTVGQKPNGASWNIAINDPAGDGYACILSLGECAVVTSGSDVRFFVGADGKKYHHIIDPASGYPADTGLLSVSVIHEDAAVADGLSTAFFVLGVDASLSIAKEYGAEVVFIREKEILITAGLENNYTPDASAEGKYKVTVIGVD